MRLKDLADYWKLRRIAANPLQIVRYRKRQAAAGELHVALRGRPGLHLRGGCADFHMFHRIWVRDEYRLDPLLPAGFDCVVDLGGNVGIFSARVAPRARRVITCEPVPENFERLEQNLVGDDHVVRLRVAVTDRRGSMPIFTPARPSTTGMFSAYRDQEAWLTEQSIDVPTIAFAELFEEHAIDEIDLLKIDIEGGEYDILYPAEHLLPRVRRIHGEYHDVRAADPRTRIASFAGWLRDQGYHVEVAPHRRLANHGMFFAHRT